MKRKSAAEKIAIGTYRFSRDKKAPQFVAATAAKAPAHIRQNKVAHQQWKAVFSLLSSEGVLKETDIALLELHCLMYARWRAAADDVEKNGQTLKVVSTTRTGRTEKPIANPAVRNEIAYAAAAARMAVKLGLNPIDRQRLSVSPFDESSGTDDDISDYEV